MLPLIIAGMLGLLPILFNRMPANLQRWMTHNPFSLSSNPSANNQETALRSEPLFFHIDPGKIPDVDISVDGKVLPPLLFPVVSGPHCLAESDIAPQPVCYAVVDEPEFFDVTRYHSDDPFVQSWDQLRASLTFLAGTRMAATFGVCFVLALFVPFVPDLVYHLSNMAYTIASAGFIFGYTAACHAVGLASVLLYILDGVGWVLNRVSSGSDQKANDEEALHVSVDSPLAPSISTDVLGLALTSTPPQSVSLSSQAESTGLVSSSQPILLASPASTTDTPEENPDTSASSLEVEPASPQSMPEEPSLDTSIPSPSPAAPPFSETAASQAEAAPLSPSTIGGLSLQALYICSKQYQAQITAALPTPQSEGDVDVAPGSVTSKNVDTRRVRFNSDSITLKSSQSLSDQDEPCPDAYSRSHADAAVLDRSLALKEAEVERLERSAIAPVSPLGFNLRTSNLKEVTPSLSPPSFAKYELPAIRMARMRTQSESPASLASPKTPIDIALGNGPRIRSDSIVDTPGPSITDSAANWRTRTRRSRGATFSILKQDDTGSPLYPKSALRKGEITPSSPSMPAAQAASSPAATSTPIRMPLGPAGSPFKKRRGGSVAVKTDADVVEAPDWVKVASAPKRVRMRTRTSSRNEKENMPSLWNVVNRTPRPRLPSSGPSFLNV